MAMASADGTGSDPAASSPQPIPGPAQPEEPQPQAAPSTMELVEALSRDRLWLLRQLDSGAWPEWRLDLAALERELGELLDRLAEGANRER
jgi:hypothetical protein